MTYTQIKNLLVPPAKRTAATVTKWVAKMPSLPWWPKLVAEIGLLVLKQNLVAILVAGLFMPTIPITFAVLAAGLLVFLSAYTIYESREAIAKSMVVLLAAL